MKKKLAIIGSGDLGQQIAHLALAHAQYEVIGYFDDYRKKNTNIKGITCIGKIDEIEDAFRQNLFDELIIGIGYKHLSFKKELFQRFKGNIPFATIIHPSVHVDNTVRIGEGVVIYPGSILDQYVHIGDNVVINVGCCIAHDTSIGAHSFLSPRVAIAGFVDIGEMNILGINSTIIDNIKTVEQVQLGGGSVVIKSIEKRGLYVGNPIRFVR